ncbi:MAG TPA: hypothetical protein VNZ43_10250 [Sphingomonadaceae bacterium]|nr:hypothetical protein [Sphingomonadaceae bacterium]
MGKACLAMAAATILSGGISLAGPALAQGGDSARLQAIEACGSIADKSDRLACYDSAARPAAAPAVPAPARTAPATSASRTSTASAAPVGDSFGSEMVENRRPLAERAQPVEEIRAEVVSATDNGVGHWTIALKDGARWQMTERGVNFLPPRPGETIRIRRGALGSYLMHVRHQPAVRVTRLR